MVNEIFKDANDRMCRVIDHYTTEVASIRTGRANPGLVESVKVDYYGSMSPLKNISQITPNFSTAVLLYSKFKNLKRCFCEVV